MCRLHTTVAHVNYYLYLSPAPFDDVSGGATADGADGAGVFMREYHAPPPMTRTRPTVRPATDLTRRGCRRLTLAGLLRRQATAAVRRPLLCRSDVQSPEPSCRPAREGLEGIDTLNFYPITIPPRSPHAHQSWPPCLRPCQSAGGRTLSDHGQPPSREGWRHSAGREGIRRVQG